MAWPDTTIGAGDWVAGFNSAPNMQSKVTDRLDALVPRLADTGQQTTGLGGGPVGSWGTFTYTIDEVGPWVVLTLSAVRTTTTLTMASDGGLADNTVATLTDHLPRAVMIGNYVATGCQGGSTLDTAGNWKITDGHPNATIAPGDTVRSSWIFLT